MRLVDSILSAISALGPGIRGVSIQLMDRRASVQIQCNTDEAAAALAVALELDPIKMHQYGGVEWVGVMSYTPELSVYVDGPHRKMEERAA